MNATLLATAIFSLIIFGLYFALMSVRLFFKKDGEFRGTCATLNPMLKESGAECVVCGKKPGTCENASAKIA